MVAGQGLLTDNAGTGEPAIISLAILFGGPLSITALGHVEVSRLLARYPGDFPFRDGPLTSPAGLPFGSAGVRRYPWPLAVVSVIVPGVVVAAFALYRAANPVAVETGLAGIKDGQCIQYRPDPGATVRSLPVIPCSAMHWGQFIGLISIGDAASTSYPGDAVARQESRAVCTQAFNQAVGSNPRGYALWSSYPDEDDWNNQQWSNAACVAEAG